MRIGVVACNIMRRELDKLLGKNPDVTDIIYLEAALHVYPKKMKEKIKEQIDLIKADVDVVFLGYGFCQSLKGIEEEIEIPVIMPQVDDCLSILLTPERYAGEIKKEVGTWFMTPGWAEIGAEMIIKELHLDRAGKYGRDPLEMAKRLFTHYKRGLFIDTGVGDNDFFLGKAEEFCKDFDLVLEKTTAVSPLLEESLNKCGEIACPV